MTDKAIGRVQLPATFGVLVTSHKAPKDYSTDAKSVRAACRKFGTDLEAGKGLIKYLQGTITQACHTEAEVALLSLYNPMLTQSVRAELLASVRLTETDLTVYTTNQISVYVHQFAADSAEACLTEILMDRRKYHSGDPDRFDAALKAFHDFVKGSAQNLDPADFIGSDGTHVSKGKTTIRLRFLNAAGACLGGRKLYEFLGQYPVTNAIIGHTSQNGKCSEDKTVSLAHAIVRHEMGGVMDILHKRVIEAPLTPMVALDPIVVEALRCKEEEGRRQYLARLKRKTYGLSSQTWHDNLTVFLANAIEAASNGKLPMRIETRGDSLGLVFFEDTPERFKLSVSLPVVAERASASHESGGFYVTQKGGSQMFARHNLVCLNRNAGRMSQDTDSAKKAIVGQDVVLVTFLDVLAMRITDHAYVVLRQANEGVDVKRLNREFRTMVSETIRGCCRPIGKYYDEQDGITYNAVDVLPLQVQIVPMETSNGWSQTVGMERFLDVVSGKSFPDPLRAGITHRFNVCATPKGGTFRHVTVKHGGTERPLVALYSQPGQHNTERGDREATGNTTSQLLNKSDMTVTTSVDDLMPDMHPRTTTLTFASVTSLGVFTDGDGKDADGMYLTPDGWDKTRYVPKSISYGPMSPEMAVRKAVEITGDRGATVETLTALGWGTDVSLRLAGSLDSRDLGKYVKGANQGEKSVDVFTEHVTLISPVPNKEALGRKLGCMGHKSVAVPLGERYYVKVGGKKTPIDVIMAQETVGQKKLQGDLVLGQSALLGHRHFDGTETAEYTEDHLEDLKAVSSPRDGRIAYLTAKDGKVTKVVVFALYNEKGEKVGECIPSMHRSFVLKENEIMASSEKRNGMAHGPWETNLFGGEIKLSDDQVEIMEMMAALVSLGATLAATTE